MKNATSLFRTSSELSQLKLTCFPVHPPGRRKRLGVRFENCYELIRHQNKLIPYRSIPIAFDEKQAPVREQCHSRAAERSSSLPIHRRFETLLFVAIAKNRLCRLISDLIISDYDLESSCTKQAPERLMAGRREVTADSIAFPNVTRTNGHCTFFSAVMNLTAMYEDKY